MQGWQRRRRVGANLGEQGQGRRLQSRSKRMGRCGGGMGVLVQGCIGGRQASESEHELKANREHNGVCHLRLKTSVEKNIFSTFSLEK